MVHRNGPNLATSVRHSWPFQRGSTVLHNNLPNSFVIRGLSWYYISIKVSHFHKTKQNKSLWIYIIYTEIYRIVLLEHAGACSRSSMYVKLCVWLWYLLWVIMEDNIVVSCHYNTVSDFPYNRCHSSPLNDDVIKWKHFPRYWPFVLGIHRSPVNSPHKGQWRGVLKFSLICAWING